MLKNIFGGRRIEETIKWNGNKYNRYNKYAKISKILMPSTVGERRERVNSKQDEGMRRRMILKDLEDNLLENKS